MTIADSLTHVNTIYNTKYGRPRMLVGDPYTVTTSVFGLRGTLDTGLVVANSLLNTSVNTEYLGVTAASLTSQFPFIATSASSLPRFSPFFAGNQNAPQDTDWGKQIILVDASGGGATDRDFDSLTDRTSAVSPDFSGASDIRYSALRMRKTFRFMSNLWYGYGYQRSARIQHYGAKITPSEWITQMSDNVYLCLGIRVFATPVFDTWNGLYTATFSIGSGDYVLPLVHLAGNSPAKPNYNSVGFTTGHAAASEPSGIWDMYEDVGCSTPQTFVYSFVPHRYAPPQISWVGSAFGGVAAGGDVLLDSTVNRTTGTALTGVEFDPIDTAVRSYFSLSQTVVQPLPLTNPTTATEVFLQAPHQANAPFSSADRRDRWYNLFVTAATTLSYRGNALTVVYTSFEPTALASGYLSPATFVYSPLDANHPYWLFNRNVWYRGPAVIGSANAPFETKNTSLGGISPVWSTPTSLTPSVQYHPYPFPGAQVRGLYPRSVRHRMSNAGMPNSLNRNSRFIPSDVVNVIVLSDLSASEIATSTSSTYQFPAIVTPDTGGANDLLDIRELVRVSSLIVPAMRGFKTLIFYDIDPVETHERLEMPVNSLITSTTTADAFFQHTANWSGGHIEYWTREGNIYSYYPQIATGPYSINFSNLGLRAEATLGTIRTFSMPSVRDARNNLAITHIQTLIAQHDPNGHYVVYCGTISASDPPGDFISRVLAASD